MLLASAGAASSGGGNFLIPNGTFIVELVIFLKWILPPLQEVGETRRARIRTSLQGAEQARAEAQNLTAERDRLLAEARVQARGILDHANQGADAALEQARVRGQEEYERLVQASRQEIDVESRSARDELVRRLDSLVLAASERVLGSEIDAALHRDVIKDAIAAAIGAASGAGSV